MLQNYRFPLMFLLLYAAFQMMYLSSPEWLVKGWLVERLTVIPSAHFINLLWPEAAVRAEAGSLLSAAGNINVLRGCEGTETMLMLIAAVLAAGRRWQHWVVGLVAGIAMVYVLNQFRIAGLYWVVVNARSQFDLMHGYIAPLAIVGATIVFFVAWLQFTAKEPRPDGVA